jgi:hypothetical protein
MGPPPVIVPQELINALEETYESKTANSVPVDEKEDGDLFIKYSKLYAKKRNLSFRSKWNTETNILEFQLTDKRKYTRSTLPREK